MQLTYKQTRDLELALKTAVIAYFTNRSLSGVKTGITGTDATAIAQRTPDDRYYRSSRNSRGGGSEKDIINGFLKGASMTLANEAYKTIISEGINDEIPTEAPIDKSDELLKERYGILTDSMEIRSLPR